MHWIQDFKFGFRLLLKNPVFTLIALVTLTLGIGANTAMFTLLDQVVLQPLPYQDPERLVMIWETRESEGLSHEQLSPVNFLDYRALDSVFVDAAAWWHPEINLTDDEGQPIRVKTIEVSSNFCSVLGVAPALGQDFPQEERLDSDQLQILISHRLWQSRYGGSSEVLGRVLQLNDRPYTVAGVMPPGFNFPPETDVWQLLRWNLANHSRSAHFMEAVGRLRDGIDLSQANRDLAGVARRLETENPSSNKDWSARMVPLHDELIGVFRDGLTILFGSVSLLLLLACANVANLLLARASSREREIAVRSALGAKRARLLRQLMVESLLLAGFGTFFGFLLAQTMLRLFVAFSWVDLPRLEQVQVDLRVLGFTALVAVVTALLFGLAPALQLIRANIFTLLKEAGRANQSGGGKQLRNALVVIEVALSVVLLVGSGLLIRSFYELLQEDPGFRTETVATVNIELPSPRQRDGWPAIAQFYQQLLERIEAQPEVSRVGAVNFLPLRPGWRIPIAFRDRPDVPQDEEPRVQYVTVTPGYFSTLGIPLLRGRDFSSIDRIDSTPVVIINQTLAERFWPGESPIDRVILSRASGIGPLGRLLVGSQDMQVVGVVGDVKNNSLRSDVEPTLYFPSNQFAYKNMNLVLQGRMGPAELGALVAREVQALDPKVPVPAARSMESVLTDATAQSRFIMLLMCGFASLALVLAAIGIYGVLSYTVSERVHEIGIRMALGAQPSQVQTRVVSEGFILAAFGAIGGLLGALILSRLAAFSTLLYQVDPSDLPAFGASLMLMLVVALIACYAPARRASTVDPIKALRNLTGKV